VHHMQAHQESLWQGWCEARAKAEGRASRLVMARVESLKINKGNWENHGSKDSSKSKGAGGQRRNGGEVQVSRVGTKDIGIPREGIGRCRRPNKGTPCNGTINAEFKDRTRRDGRAAGKIWGPHYRCRGKKKCRKILCRDRQRNSHKNKENRGENVQKQDAQGK